MHALSAVAELLVMLSVVVQVCVILLYLCAFQWVRWLQVRMKHVPTVSILSTTASSCITRLTMHTTVVSRRRRKSKQSIDGSIFGTFVDCAAAVCSHEWCS